MKTVFINPKRCIGCKQCQIACSVEHSQDKNLYQALFKPLIPRPRIFVAPALYPNTSFPNKCRHCDPAPCMSVCPTGAISRDTDHGIVLVDGIKCINCAMCAMVCPFAVLNFHFSFTSGPKRSVAVKCDQCIERQREGKVPICVEACKVDALVFGELNDLLKAARARLSREVSEAVAEIKSDMTRVPAHIEDWRRWGEVVEKINKR